MDLTLNGQQTTTDEDNDKKKPLSVIWIILIIAIIVIFVVILYIVLIRYRDFTRKMGNTGQKDPRMLSIIDQRERLGSVPQQI